MTSFLAPLMPAFLALAVVGIKLQLGDRRDTAATSIAFALVALVLVRQALLARELTTSVDTPDARLIRGLIHLALGKAEAKTAKAGRS